MSGIGSGGGESAAGTVARNTGMLFFSSVLAKILQAIYIVVLSRYLGDLVFGRFSVAMSWAVLFGVLVDSGFDALIMREVARRPSTGRSLLRRAVGWRSVLSIPAVGAVVLVSWFAGEHSSAPLLGLFYGLSAVLDKTSGTFFATMRAFQVMQYEAIVRIVAKFIEVGAGLALVFLDAGYMSIALLAAVAALMRLGMAGGALFRSRVLAPEGQAVTSERTAGLPRDFNLGKALMPFAGYEFILAFYGAAPVLILSIFQNDSQVGWFNAPFKILSFAMLVSASLEASLIPMLSRLFMSGSRRFATMFTSSLRYMTMMGLPLSVAGFVLGPDLINVALSGDYSTSMDGVVLCFRILVWVVPLWFINSLQKSMLWALGMARKAAISIAAAAIAMVISSLVMVPVIGFSGTALAVLIGEVVLFISFLVHLAPGSRDFSPGRTFILPAIGSAGLGLVLTIVLSLATGFTGSDGTILIIVRDTLALIPAFLVYLAFLWLTGAIKKDDIVFARSVAFRALGLGSGDGKCHHGIRRTRREN